MKQFKFKLKHNALSYDNFTNSSGDANITFYINICAFNKITKELVFDSTINVTGDYYCCGSKNFENEKFKTTIKQFSVQKKTKFLKELKNFIKSDKFYIKCFIKHDNIYNLFEKEINNNYESDKEEECDKKL